MKKIKKSLLLVCATLTLATIPCMGACGSASQPAPPAAWLVNSCAPTSESKGNIGDIWFNTETCDIYQLTANGWELCGNNKGDRGDKGSTGKNGVDGTAWVTGTGAPTVDVKGNQGDLYFDVDSLAVYKMNEEGAWEYLATLNDND